MWVRTQNREKLVNVEKFNINTLDFNIYGTNSEKKKEWLAKNKKPFFRSKSKHNHIANKEAFEIVYNVAICSDNSDLLATYPTKERAMEVLDEIQEHIIGKIFIPTPVLEHDWELPSAKIEHLPIVYQMPKE